MPNFFKQLVTNADNETHNVLRHGVLWGGIALILMQGYAIYKGQTFEVQQFGIALGALLGGGGVGIGVSSKAETDPSSVKS